MTLDGEGLSARIMREVDPPEVDQRITFEGLFDCASTCRVRIWRGPRVVLVVDEGQESGTSITNGAEHIRDHLGEDFDVDDGYTFFELYDGGGFAAGPDRVTFSDNPMAIPPLEPDWHPSTIEEVTALIQAG